MENIWRILKKLKIELPHDPAILVGTCTVTFITALFTIAKLWKQLRCFTTNEQIKKMVIYTMEFYSAIKKNEILFFVGKWIEMENIILGEISQVQKAKNCMLSHMWNIDLIQI
jgi:hypothetical protein